MCTLTPLNQLIARIIRRTEKGTNWRRRQKRVKRKEKRRGLEFMSRKKGCVVPSLKQHRTFIHSSTETLNAIVVLNYGDLHGNDDYLLRFSE